MKSKKLLIDTHIWIWYVLGAESLSPKEIDLINRAATNGELYLSAISFWEVAMLYSKKRLTLRKPCLQWVNEAKMIPGLNILELSSEICVESAELPGDFHGDPADRLIVASARIENAALLTHDLKIKAYSLTGHLKLSQVDF